jgi:type I restriction enzyme M protein
VPQTGNANYGWILNMVSKLSDNGVAGFILANGALSGGGTEYEIRKKLIENKLVEAILILPRNLFYTTDISVTLWIINNNKKERQVKLNDIEKNYRNREEEILFMDLREVGIPFEKKYKQFSDENIVDISETYHKWQQRSNETSLRGTKQSVYRDIPEFCYSASIEEVRKKDYSLVPSKYVEFVNRDENINFDEKMSTLQTEFAALLKNEAQSKTELLNVFKDLGYEIKL